MKKTILTIALFLFALSTQATTYSIQVYIGAFIPSMLTIHAGDTVVWHNMEGSHNISGLFTAFPANAESFRSGNPDSSLWTYKKKFTVIGGNEFYSETDLFSSGYITVLGATDVPDINLQKPLGEMLIYDISGKLIYKGFDNIELPQGIYIKVQDGKIKKIIK